ncbi:MAG: hypothetical protein RMJ31_06470 [Nitrososphaerota archaeon]|nr:zinc ribbon domain-containing protein [Nitrososphaerales archaeon]MCX8191399.1 zinc ribbon domain-containing protein [Nitrososphaerales archaeon]MDW8045397.1 hypothetical protein [Nitrososphaerota archaeon]
MVSNLILQAGLESLLLLLPLLICCMLMPMLRQRAESRALTGYLEMDAWFTPQNISESFELIKKLTKEWKSEVKQTGMNIFRKQPSQDVSFITVEEIEPRLLKMNSKSEGGVVFELTEVEGGGTFIRTTYSPQARSRIQSLKARLPLKVYTMKSCAKCGRMLLSDFIHCPYCGEKQVVT